MEYEIYPLSIDRLNDYLYFFDNVAFSDDDDWKGCYCVAYHLINVDVEKINRRELAIDLIKQNKLCGYLAYLNGNVVGWCNSSDKESYPKLVADKTIYDDNDKGKKIKSIVCFSIALSMRSKGVATKLLEKICDDAKIENYDYIESYPGKIEYTDDFSRNYLGTANMYKKFGFEFHKESNNYYIYRKNLKG
jgi:ribosomal protein S18 acetylase RimI-like enzyme